MTPGAVTILVAHETYSNIQYVLLMILDNPPSHMDAQGGKDRAGLTIVPVVPWEGASTARAPDQMPNFYHAVLTFECLNVQCMYA